MRGATYNFFWTNLDLVPQSTETQLKISTTRTVQKKNNTILLTIH